MNPRTMAKRIRGLFDPEADEMRRHALEMLRRREVDPLPSDLASADVLLRLVASAIDAGIRVDPNASCLRAALGRHPAFDECPSPAPEFAELRRQIDALLPPSKWA
tara:strand:+ start:1227 stop:1544 length:318 start_codon:yes stop_codon:yes gene_type:complete